MIIFCILSANPQRVQNLISVVDGKKQKAKLPSIKDLTQDEEIAIIRKMLRSYISERDAGLTLSELVNKYRAELQDLCTHDKDTQDAFGFVNTWWVFGEVSAKLKYDIFMAEAENVGYKRTKRGENKMPNELFRVNNDNDLILDDGISTTILDYIRSIKWD